MYDVAVGDLEFGDIFEAEWFFSAYLKRDAVPLAEFKPSKPKIERAWQVAKPSEHRDYLFAHGQQRRAILLADDCEAESIVKRKGTGRLVFAAIERLPLGAGARDEALQTPAFRRFPLAPEATFSGGIVHFQQLFAVAVEGVVTNGDKDPRIARLDAETRSRLEMRWAAYATRRGPLSHADNGEKLARALSGEGDAAKLEALRKRNLEPEASHVAIGTEVARSLGFAWQIEGGAMNDVADVLEGHGALDAPRDQLIALMKELAASAQRSAALLEGTRSP